MEATAQESLHVHHGHGPSNGTTSRNVAGAERIASIIGGAALAAYGLRRKDIAGSALALVGGLLVGRGATGHCMAYGALGISTADGGVRLAKQHGEGAVLDASKAQKVQRSVTIEHPRAELYRFWRNFENLPRIMSHLESVTVVSAKRSRWRAKAPAGGSVEWDADIINEVENELIAWKSVSAADIPNAGSVHFSDAPGGRGTEVKVVLEYQPPAGRLGVAVAKLFREEPELQVRGDLRRFKQSIETGEIATIDGQTSGR